MSLHLSRLLLNPASPAARADLRNPYDLHRTLSRGFGDHHDAYQEARCLFRLEELQTPPRVLVQSLAAPDWEALPERYLLQAAEIKEIRPEFEEGQRLRFLLVANPTRREPGGNAVDPESGKAKDGPRRALVSKDPAETERACRAWLKRKGEAGGFLPLLFEVEDCGVR